jgi:hypothetical protein
VPAGAMVAVIKLAGLLDVLPGIGLFALAILSLMMIRIAGRDIVICGTSREYAPGLPTNSICACATPAAWPAT